MNNASASPLQKLTFILVLFIAAALGYLAMREWLRRDQARASVAAAAPTNSAPVIAPAPRATTPVLEKITYAPLRPRIETNVLRVVTNQLVNLRQVDERPVVIGKIEKEIIPAIPSVVVEASRVSPQGAAATGSALPGVVVSGRVLLRGRPPPETALALDAECGSLNTAPVTTRNYLVSESGGLAEVFIYIKSGLTVTGPPEVHPPALDINKCQFEPYVLGVRAGQPFRIFNSASVLDNVRIIPANRGNHEFSLLLPPKGKAVEKIFDKPEVFVQVKSDLHPGMMAYLAVVDHPWYAYTDREGAFKMYPPLPPGRYTIAAAHPKAGELIQSINVPSPNSSSVTFTFELPNGVAQGSASRSSR